MNTGTHFEAQFRILWQKKQDENVLGSVSPSIVDMYKRQCSNRQISEQLSTMIDMIYALQEHVAEEDRRLAEIISKYYDGCCIMRVSGAVEEEQ